MQLLRIAAVFVASLEAVNAANGTLSGGGFTSSISKPQISEDTEPRSSFAKAENAPKHRFKLVEFPQDAADIVHGLVETFFNKQHLEPGEVQCLERGTQDLAKDVMTVAEHIIMLVQKVMGKRKAMPGLGQFTHVSSASDSDSAEAPQQAPPSGLFAERRLQDNESTPGLLLSTSAVIMEFGFSMQKVAALSHQIMHACLHEDGLKAIALAAEHAADIEYVGQHLVINGADVCSELAESVRQWQLGDRKGFGNALGIALRKIVLSSKIVHDDIPKGMPSEETLLNITNAFMESFFGPGVGMQITTFQGEDVADSFYIDLHKCFGENAHLLESMWADTMYMYKKEAERRRNERLGLDDHDDHGTKTGFEKALESNMMQIPSALQKCNVDDERRQMLRDAFIGLGSADGLAFSLKGFYAPPDATFMEQLSRTVQQWKTLGKDGGLEFGHSLGKLSQELAAAVFPEKYSADDLGGLRRRPTSRAQLPLVLLTVALLVPILAAVHVLRRKRVSSQVASHQIFDLEEVDIDHLELLDSEFGTDAVAETL